jgi:iron(III) transport system substrate-binding protein
MLNPGCWGIAVAGVFVAASLTGAAEAQKQVVVYTANEDTLNTLVFSTFEKDTGIKVRPVAAGSGVLVRRLSAEKDRPQGDVLWGVSRSLLQTNKDYFAPHRSAHRHAIPTEFRDPDDLWIGTNLHLMVILQNTKLVPETKAPKGWADLLDKNLKDKIAFTDPANSGAAYTTTTLLVGLFGGGEAGWQKTTAFFANSKVLNKASLVFQGVGQGEYPVGVSLEYAGYLWASHGAPVKVIYPIEGTVVQMEGSAIIKGGPNPEAAAAFVEYVNRKDVRELILANTFRRPARQDVDLTKMPGRMPSLSAIKIAPYDELSWTRSRQATLQRIQNVIAQTR